jgi:hypothetical protein
MAILALAILSTSSGITIRHTDVWSKGQRPIKSLHPPLFLPKGGEAVKRFLGSGSADPAVHALWCLVPRDWWRKESLDQ